MKSITITELGRDFKTTIIHSGDQEAYNKLCSVDKEGIKLVVQFRRTIKIGLTIYTPLFK